jgi:hypothetical protein
MLHPSRSEGSSLHNVSQRLPNLGRRCCFLVGLPCAVIPSEDATSVRRGICCSHLFSKRRLYAAIVFAFVRRAAEARMGSQDTDDYLCSRCRRFPPCWLHIFAPAALLGSGLSATTLVSKTSSVAGSSANITSRSGAPAALSGEQCHSSVGTRQSARSDPSRALRL